METCMHCGSRRDEWDPPHGSAACVAVLEAALAAERLAVQQERADFQKGADILRAGIGIRDRELELTRSRARDAEAHAAVLYSLLLENERGVFGIDPLTKEHTDPWTAEGAFQWHKRAQAALSASPSSAGGRMRLLERCADMLRCMVHGQTMWTTNEVIAALDELGGAK